MNKIYCDVNKCSHNDSGVCFANRVNIGGYAVQAAEDTCCGSFLDRKLYSDLTNNAGGNCDCLVCKAEVCTYNKNHLCTLDSIQVAGEAAKIYTETYCSSFNSKQ